MKLSQRVSNRLQCPRCGSLLLDNGGVYECTDQACAASFPTVDGAPILIDERASVFSIADCLTGQVDYYSRRSRLEEALLHWSPEISWNLKADQNYRRLGELLASVDHPAVLIIGGRVAGAGIEELLRSPGIEFVETDIQPGPRTQLICDAHALPFAGSTFDAVIAQAVLEHVVDPYRCASEMHRVLKEGGMVYAETPFMQQVHEGRHDFTRFTHLGHRRLFRHFEEVASGPTGGPAMALAWSIRYLLLSVAPSERWTGLLGGLARTFFWLKYVDERIIDKPATLDAASGYYFLGRKSGAMLEDRDLLQQYRGRQ